jgi:nitrogenase molybdenum-iron protein NifN
LLAAQTVILGDLEDFERGAADCDLLVTHSHGRQAAERLNKPLLRIGFPVFDRVGNAHRCQVGYRGTMALIYEIANLMIAQIGHHHATDWPLTPEALHAARTVITSSSCGATCNSTACSATIPATDLAQASV